MKKTPILTVLATNLRQAMARHPTLDTQMRLGQRSGISQRTVGRMLNGEVNPQLGHVEAVADALGVTVTELLTDYSSGAPELRYDRQKFAKLSPEDRAKIESFIEFTFVSQDKGSSSDAPFKYSEVIKASPAQEEMVKRVAQRDLSNKTLSIDEDQTKPHGGRRGRR
ncbi:helix-turn-helix domain-containing protein [Paraburkholderia lacunae]|uniref:XRE family transcriptional regulator n=1 Tax=Paraburkholderia lacunae TaxID=2211104 RepID=A0A370N780_9BURK|nr:helix-turn-helix domain-containing protein [Paraburkholderia lacunae]RDK01452.1 XRE family transcriptional regulator [Paraburkholderia lacunae]